ncbi:MULTISPECIES: LysE family translocator [Streptacidiphilus]|uniref:LysE family translocator n=1 Tax=Streptacidiphilus cavernicola TaxID=3342716 RepID=A0ABV6UTN0_9ACTN|nr:LysE family translocator [Streptacidiphilus jeojiense]
MDTMTAIWSFALVVGLLTLTPGLDTALILRTAALRSRPEAWGVVLGIQAGTLAWGMLSSLGVSALLTASHTAYEALRVAGAGYLLWMGGRMLWGTLRRRSGEAAADTDADVAAAAGDAAGAGGRVLVGLRRGALTNLLNPKVGVFYVAVLPQFIPAGAPHLAMGALLTCVHVAEGLTWSVVLVAFAGVLRNWLRRPVARRVLDRVTGVVVVGFGLRLALGD